MKVSLNEEKKVNEETQEQKKLSYEELEKVTQNLDAQCRKLYNELMETRQVIANFNDIGMLLSIIEKKDSFDAVFIARCAKRIQDLITEMLDVAEQREKEEN